MGRSYPTRTWLVRGRAGVLHLALLAAAIALLAVSFALRHQSDFAFHHSADPAALAFSIPASVLLLASSWVGTRLGPSGAISKRVIALRAALFGRLGWRRALSSRLPAAVAARPLALPRRPLSRL